MNLLLPMSEAARRTWALGAPESIPVIVHPFYEYLRRELPGGGPSVMVATTPEGAAEYRRLYARMPKVAMDRYPDQLMEVLKPLTHAVFFEEYDRLFILRMLLPDLPWDNILVVPTNLGNSTPCEIKVPAGENPWYPQVADAFSHIGSGKEFVVYGGGFMPLPDAACAGSVLLFLLGLQTQEMIRAARPGNKAVLRV